VLTLAFDEAAFEWFDDLRRRWFPPERNLVPAHLTLFHALPGAQFEAVVETLREACGATAPMALEVAAPFSLGGGVAYAIRSEALTAFRAGLATAFEPWLTKQDRAPFRPHVTVQNKATAEAARELLLELQADHQPFEVEGAGVRVWRYMGGPWRLAGALEFTR
jgi:2'-5' RNA ligase